MKLSLTDEELIIALEKMGIYQTRREFPVVPKLASRWQHWTPHRIKCAVRAHVIKRFVRVTMEAIFENRQQILSLFANGLYPKGIKYWSPIVKKTVCINRIRLHFINEVIITVSHRNTVLFTV